MVNSTLPSLTDMWTPPNPCAPPNTQRIRAAASPRPLISSALARIGPSLLRRRRAALPSLLRRSALASSPPSPPPRRPRLLPSLLRRSALASSPLSSAAPPSPPHFFRPLQYTNAAQAEARPPPEWAARVAAAAAEAGDRGDVPWSAGLAEMLARTLLSPAAPAAAWKYAEAALSARLASPALLLALLSSRVIPHWFARPTAYRLYLELLWRHGFKFCFQMKAPNFKKIMQLIDDKLSLSKIFGFSTCEPGVFIVEFVLCVVWQLADAALDDEGLLELTHEKKAQWPTRPEDVNAFEGTFSEQRTEKIEKLQKMNSVITVELLGHLLHDKVITHILSLARENMVIPHWFARPTAYRLYLELLWRHGFKFCFQMTAMSTEKTNIVSAKNSTPWWLLTLYLLQMEGS